MNGTRAAIYVRVSSRVQAADGKASLASLAAQEASARAWAAQHTPPLDIVRVYVEPGYSATKYRRPAMDQVRADAQAGLFDWLIIDFGDRFTRGGIAHYGRFLSEFDEAGVGVYLVYEKLDLSDPQQRMMGAFIAHQAEEDNRKRAERRRRTYEAYAAAGHYICGKRPPYGFRFPEDRRSDGRLKKGRLIADPITGEVMRRLFREHAAGATLRGLKCALDREHVPTPTGKPFWDVAVISKLLRNPLYWGEAEVKLNGQRIAYPPGVVEPLIDKETAKAVQARLAQNRAYSPRTTTTRQYALLYGGRGRCAVCGSSLHPHRETAVRRKSGVPYITYRCTYAIRHLNTCPGLRVPAEHVDQVVWDQLRDILLHREKLEQLAAKQAEAELADDPASDVQRLKRTITDSERRRNNLQAAIADTDDKDTRTGLLLDLEMTNTALKTHRADLAVLEHNLAAYAERHKTLAEVGDWATRYRAVFLLHEPVDERGRAVIRAVMRALNVTAAISKDASGAVLVDLNLEFSGATALPYWESFFGDLDTEELAVTQAALTDPAVVEALEALTARLQAQRISLLPSLRS